jgi:hypothetical protein
MGETDEEVQDTCLAFDDDLDHDVDDIEIEEADCILMVIVHAVNPCHFICTLSMVSGHIAEASSRTPGQRGSMRPCQQLYTPMLMFLVRQPVMRFHDVGNEITQLS